MNVLEKGTRDTVAAASSKQAFQSMYVLEKGTGDAAASSSKEALLKREGRKEGRKGGMS
jgi:NAD(P)H-hydrate repair Nnr-like enzyme with NAD(P)H-hydrate dehydratase domain